MLLKKSLFIALCILAGQASAGSSNPPQEDFQYGRGLYCRGDGALNLPLTGTIRMEDNEAIADLERWGSDVVCKRFPPADMKKITEYVFGVSQGSSSFKVKYFEFHHNTDDGTDNAVWYRWIYDTSDE